MCEPGPWRCSVCTENNCARRNQQVGRADPRKARVDYSDACETLTKYTAHGPLDAILVKRITARARVAQQRAARPNSANISSPPTALNTTPAAGRDGHLARCPEPPAALLHPALDWPAARRPAEPDGLVVAAGIPAWRRQQAQLRHPGTRHPLRPRLRLVLSRQLADGRRPCEATARPGTVELHQRAVGPAIRGRQDIAPDPRGECTAAGPDHRGQGVGAQEPA